MDKNKFSQSELQELEALEIRGGNGTSSTAPQIVCTNTEPGCSAGNAQGICTNTVAGCGGSVPPAQGSTSCGVTVV